VVVATLFGALLFGAAPDEPVLDHQPVVCTAPEKNARLCAYVADDGEVRRSRVYFRAKGQPAFYYVDMAFDGIQFCATLPAPKKNVPVVEYYVWAVDNDFLSQRTRTYEIAFTPTGCEFPVFDEDPTRTKGLVVAATSEKQGKKIESFHEEGIGQFLHVEKRKKTK